MTLRTPARNRPFTRSEERAHALIHGAGALAALPFGFVLAAAVARGDPPARLASGLFGLSLVLMLAISAVYHGLPESAAKRTMATVDNDAVYLLIAGTYGPYCLIAIPGGSGPLLLSLVWTVAFLGIGVRTLFPGRFRLFALASYLAMGWLVAPFFPELRAALPPDSYRLLVAGGICYSLGTLFYALDRRRWLHVVWHFAVVGGAACHMASILALAAGRI